MMASTKVVLPGVVASMLFAGPALAAQDVGAAARKPSVSSHPTHHRGRVFGVRARRFRHDSGAELATVPLAQNIALWSTPHDAFVSGEDAAGEDAPGGDVSHARPAQVGMASWYGGSQWHGNMTAGGERFDQDALTAAHATLPLGTLVRVSTLNGSGTVVVRITDRPGTRRRIIDLSRGAARELGILDRGIAMVSLQPL